MGGVGLLSSRSLPLPKYKTLYNTLELNIILKRYQNHVLHRETLILCEEA